jgi:hypothetical protein
MVDKGVDAKGKALVQVTVKDFANLDQFMGSVQSGTQDEYCPNIMCNVIKSDPTHSLIIQRLNTMEMDYDGTVSRLQPAITESRGAKIVVKTSIPPLYTALYLSYLYRIFKAASCATSGVAKPAEQCMNFSKAGVMAYKQVYGGGKQMKRRRVGSRKTMKRHRSVGTRRKH